MRVVETCARALLGTITIASLLLPIAPACAHEGHDHGWPPPPVNTAAAPRAAASSDVFELVAIVCNDELTIYLDRPPWNKPVKGAVVEVETPAGPSAAEVKGDAYLVTAPWIAKPGNHDLFFAVTNGRETELLMATLVVPEPSSTASRIFTPALASELTDLAMMGPAQWPACQRRAVIGAGLAGLAAGILAVTLLGRLRPVTIGARVAVGAIMPVSFVGTALVYEGHDLGKAQQEARVAGQIEVRDVAQRLPDGAVFVPKPTQRILSIRTTLIEPRTHRRSVELPGRIIPDPNARGYVQASVSGRLSPPPNGFPRLGTTVKALRRSHKSIPSAIGT